MRLLLLTDIYMSDGSFDPFRKELINICGNFFDEVFVIRTNDFLHHSKGEFISKIDKDNFKNLVIEVYPDLVFSINRVGINLDVLKILRENVKILTWFIDSYERTSPDLFNFSERDYVLLTGTKGYKDNFLEKTKLSESQIIHAPFATNTSIFYDQQINRDIDVSFVGTAFSNNYFKSILQDLSEDDPGQLEIFLKVYEQHKAKYIFNIKDFLESENFKVPSGFGYLDNADWQSIIDDQISLEKRLSAVSVLSEFNSYVCGEPHQLWINGICNVNSKLLSNGFKFQTITTPEQLAKLYNRSKIALNIQHHQAFDHSLAIRNFDIMASGSLLLTNDLSKHALEEIGFYEDEDFVCYKTVRELKEKISFYLQNEDERLKIIKSALVKVQKGHSLKDRMTEVFGNVENFVYSSNKIPKIKIARNSTKGFVTMSEDSKTKHPKIGSECAFVLLCKFSMSILKALIFKHKQLFQYIKFKQILPKITNLLNEISKI